MSCINCEKDEGVMYDTVEGDMCKVCLDNTSFQECEGCGKYDDCEGTSEGMMCESECMNNYVYCDDCGDIYHQDNATRMRNGDDYCQDCYDRNDCIRCSHCSQHVSEYRSGICLNCLRGDGEGNFQRRSFNATSKKYQSKDKGKIITSERTFGVEIECVGRANGLSQELADEMGLTGDGSIHPDGRKDSSMERNEGLEVVTPVLKGKKGEDVLRETCKTLQKYGNYTNKTTGIHVHLGGKDFLPENLKVVNFSEKAKIIAHIKKSDITPIVIPTSLYNNYVNDYNGIDRLVTLIQQKTSRLKIFNHIIIEHKDSVCRINGYVGADDNGDFTKQYKPKSTDKVLLQGGDSTKKLSTLFAFYLTFEDVLFATQPKSRRENNGYCLKLKNAFGIYDLNHFSDPSDIEKYWYKATSSNKLNSIKNNRYVSSRYYHFNLHPLFNSNKQHTVEIRLHAGTLNAKKILYWVKLHQAILDKVSDGKITFAQMKKMSDIYLLEDKIDAFFSILKLPKDTEVFYRERIERLTLSDKNKK